MESTVTSTLKQSQATMLKTFNFFDQLYPNNNNGNEGAAGPHVAGAMHQGTGETIDKLQPGFNDILVIQGGSNGLNSSGGAQAALQHLHW